MVSEFCPRKEIKNEVVAAVSDGQLFYGCKCNDINIEKKALIVKIIFYFSANFHFNLKYM